MTDKLLYAKFWNGTIVVEIGCNSSDNIPPTEGGSRDWKNSRDYPLNQVGMYSYAPDSSNTNVGDINQMAVYTELGAQGYTPRTQICGNTLTWKNIPLYLNGQPVDPDGVPMPYVQWEHGQQNDTVLVYYRADGTRLGTVVQYQHGSSGANYLAWVAGKLYTDGHVTGCAGCIRPHYIAGGIPSTKYYEWDCIETLDDAKFLRESVVEDLLEYIPTDPEGDLTEPGEGDFDTSSDNIDFPGLPSANPLKTGMVAMYQMSESELQALSHYLWDPDFVDLLVKLFNDPMEAILNLCICPIQYTGLTTTNIIVGNVRLDATGGRVPDSYRIIDFGTINIKECWASFADYSPYTKLSIFLPYIGYQDIQIDDVMRGAVQLKAYCDVFTGSVQYILKSVQYNPRGHGHNSVLYTWGGNMQYQIPITASNFSNVVTGLIGAAGSIAGGIAGAVATGGMTAPIAVGMTASAIGNVMNAKTHIQHGGGIGGAVGIFGVQTPYLILERPEQIYPTNYNHTVGIPIEKTDTLRGYSGSYVQVRGCHIEIADATSNEITEIETLLKGGVIV